MQSYSQQMSQATTWLPRCLASQCAQIPLLQHMEESRNQVLCPRPLADVVLSVALPSRVTPGPAVPLGM